MKIPPKRKRIFFQSPFTPRKRRKKSVIFNFEYRNGVYVLYEKKKLLLICNCLKEIVENVFTVILGVARVMLGDL